jgi:hypothetical protein
MKPWKFTFWTPGHAPLDDGATFGCASHGLAATNIWSAPGDSKAVFASTALQGEVIAGTHDEVLERLRHISFAPKAAIILFARGAGAEAFLRHWETLLPSVPVVGGAAACGLGEERGELLPASEDVAVLLISEEKWTAESLNVHDTHGETWEFQSSAPRTITHLRRSGAAEWQLAAKAFHALQIACGRTAQDCESITFSDAEGRNLHCSVSGTSLRVGADLPAKRLLMLRTISPPEVAERLRRFCAKPNTLVFGCAGLRSLLAAPLEVARGTITGFMFGELVILAGKPRFGNLMAARLVPN